MCFLVMDVSKFFSLYLSNFRRKKPFGWGAFGASKTVGKFRTALQRGYAPVLEEIVQATSYTTLFQLPQAERCTLYHCIGL